MQNKIQKRLATLLRHTDSLTPTTYYDVNKHIRVEHVSETYQSSWCVDP